MHYGEIGGRIDNTLTLPKARAIIKPEGALIEIASFQFLVGLFGAEALLAKLVLPLLDSHLSLERGLFG